MAEQAPVETPEAETPEPVQETAEQVWNRIQEAKATNPITKEDVRGEKPAAPGEEPAPAREPVAPKIQQFVEKHKPAVVDPIQERLDRLEALLTKPAEEPEAPDVAAEVRNLREQLEEQKREAREAAEQNAIEAEIAALREGMVANLRAEPEKYAGLVAAGYEEYVFNTVYNEQQAGRVVSEDEVASKAEAEVYQLYLNLHEAYKDKTPTSKEDTPSEAPKTETPTLLQEHSTQDEALNIDELIEKYGKHKAADLVWEASQRKNR